MNSAIVNNWPTTAIVLIAGICAVASMIKDRRTGR